MGFQDSLPLLQRLRTLEVSSYGRSNTNNARRLLNEYGQLKNHDTTDIGVALTDELANKFGVEVAVLDGYDLHRYDRVATWIDGPAATQIAGAITMFERRNDVAANTMLERMYSTEHVADWLVHTADPDELTHRRQATGRHRTELLANQLRTHSWYQPGDAHMAALVTTSVHDEFPQVARYTDYSRITNVLAATLNVLARWQHAAPEGGTFRDVLQTLADATTIS